MATDILVVDDEEDIRELVAGILEDEGHGTRMAGDSDSAVLDYIVARYGEFVLLRPPFGWRTLLLWLAPAVDA